MAKAKPMPEEEAANTAAVVAPATGATGLVNVDYSEYNKQGFEDQTASDLQIPLVMLLQGLSPAIETVPLAKPGKFLISAVEEVHDYLDLVVGAVERVFVEWVPRAGGGGFVGLHKPADPLVRQALATGKFGDYHTATGNDLVETVQLFCHLLDDDLEPTGVQVVVPITSTKLKPYRVWNTKVSTFLIDTPSGKQNPPRYAHAVRLSSVKQHNTKGDFFNVVFGPSRGESLRESLLAPTSPAFQAGKDLYDLFRTGTFSVRYQDQTASDPAVLNYSEDGSWKNEM